MYSGFHTTWVHKPLQPGPYKVVKHEDKHLIHCGSQMAVRTLFPWTVLSLLIWMNQLRPVWIHLLPPLPPHTPTQFKSHSLRITCSQTKVPHLIILTRLYGVHALWDWDVWVDYLLPTDTTKDRIDVTVKEYTSNFENQRWNGHLSDSLDEHGVSQRQRRTILGHHIRYIYDQ